VILLDVQMPGMDGPQVCRRLKAEPRTAHVPVVFVTALAPALLGARLGDCPHEGVLHKPFDLEELLAAVRRHLP
jgi:CheY-like chemotaxis protein